LRATRILPQNGRGTLFRLNSFVRKSRDKSVSVRSQ
jgi:hypothetical protein